MKPSLCIFSIFLILLSGLQAQMKYKELYTVETGVQAGIPIFDTGQGWLISGTSKGVFANRIFKLQDNGEISWYKTFAYKPISMTTKSGQTIMLDEHGNFYLMGSDGSMITTIPQVVNPERNIIIFGSGNTIYASGDDNSITSFQTDGNIDWIVNGKGDVTYMMFANNSLIVSEENAIVRYTLEGEEQWRIPTNGFASNMPVIQGNNIIWGLRNADGSKGSVLSVTFDGKKNWETEIKKGVEYIYYADERFLALGSLHSASIDKSGKLLWEQPISGKKLFPLGFNDDGRLVLGILAPDGDEEALRLTLFHPQGSIAIIGKIPLKKNTLVNVSRRGRLILVGLKDKITVYQLLTMKEYIEGEGKK